MCVCVLVCACTGNVGVGGEARVGVWSEGGHAHPLHGRSSRGRRQARQRQMSQPPAGIHATPAVAWASPSG